MGWWKLLLLYLGERASFRVQKSMKGVRCSSSPLPKTAMPSLLAGCVCVVVGEGVPLSNQNVPGKGCKAGRVLSAVSTHQHHLPH